MYERQYRVVANMTAVIQIGYANLDACCKGKCFWKLNFYSAHKELKEALILDHFFQFEDIKIVICGRNKGRVLQSFFPFFKTRFPFGAIAI